MPRSAVVTGASSGIGFAIAQRLATEGMRVHASVRSESSGQALLDASTDLDISLMVMDVDDDESVTAAFGALFDSEGPIDVLVNNAGIGGSGSIEDMPIERFEALMNTNAFGTLRCIKAVMASMRERQSGCIVNVTSQAGRVARSGMGAYNMSKFAQEALAEVVAHELAPFGVRVAIIEPGVVITPIFEKTLNTSTPASEPYQRIADRIGRVFMGAIADPTMPDHVAQIVWHAITTDDPKLRYAGSPDAEIELAARAATSDEQWLAESMTDDEEAFAAWIKRVRGFDIDVPAES